MTDSNTPRRDDELDEQQELLSDEVATDDTSLEEEADQQLEPEDDLEDPELATADDTPTTANDPLEDAEPSDPDNADDITDSQAMTDHALDDLELAEESDLDEIDVDASLDGLDGENDPEAIRAAEEQATRDMEADGLVLDAAAGADTGDDADDLAALYAQAFAVPTSVEASPDGTLLVWLQPDEAGKLELWVAPTHNGAQPEPIDLPFEPVEDRDPDSGRLVRGPQISPDNSRIAVTGVHPDGDRATVWIVPFRGGQIAGVAPDSGDDPEAETAAPVDDQVVDDAELDREAIEEEAIDARIEDGNDNGAAVDDVPFVLTDHPGADRSPRWSPDGEIIAMTSTIDGNDVITFTFLSDPGTMEILSWSRVPSKEPVWSRDGKFIAFLRPVAGGSEFHDIWCFSIEKGELQNLTAEKAANVRHSLEWVPGRNLIAYVTAENDWLGISVVNADNKAGWVVTRESGDKTEPRFASTEARLVYIRTEGFTTVLCERSLHSSAAVALDPGEGVASYGRWLENRRVAYGFEAPQKPFGILMQENTAKAERETIQPVLGGRVSGMELRQPQPLEFQIGPDEAFSGMLYRTPGTSGRIPGIVWLPDGPLTTRRGSFQLDEQALASTGIAVLTPVVHGASGFGIGVENDLRDFADTELEVGDVAEAARALGEQDGIDADKVALVGHGYGGMLALVTAGARPGSFGAVIAIDPIVDWRLEIANAEVPWRNWIVDRLGMPLTDADHFTLRTPSTFNAVIDVPLLLVRTENASESRKVQFDLLLQDLDDVGVSYTVVDAPEEPLPATLRRVSRRLNQVLAGRSELDVVHELEADSI